MCYGLYQNKTLLNDGFPVIKRGLSRWSFFVSRKLSVSVLITIIILLCVKELERKLQSITENIYYTLVMWCFEVILGALISEHQ